MFNLIVFLFFQFLYLCICSLLYFIYSILGAPRILGRPRFNSRSGHFPVSFPLSQPVSYLPSYQIKATRPKNNNLKKKDILNGTNTVKSGMQSVAQKIATSVGLVICHENKSATLHRFCIYGNKPLPLQLLCVFVACGSNNKKHEQNL